MSPTSNVAFVRIIIFPLLLIVGLTACSKHNELKPVISNSEIQQRLVGTWKHSEDFTNGSTFESTVTVAANGTYVCDMAKFSRTLYRAIHIEGQWEIKDGFLIDTMTLNTSVTNGHLPIVSQNKIIRFDTDDLVVRDTASSAFDEMAYHKEKGK